MKSKKHAKKTKAPSKLGNATGSLFESSTQEEITPVVIAPAVPAVEPEAHTEIKRERGRPKELSEDMTKTSVTVPLNSLLWLDGQCMDIRRNTKEIIDRGAIIRALVFALEKSQCDITHCQTEDEITVKVLNKLNA